MLCTHSTAVCYALDALLWVLYFTRRNRALHEHKDRVECLQLFYVPLLAVLDPVRVAAHVGAEAEAGCYVMFAPSAVEVIMLMLWFGDRSLKCQLSSHPPS